MKYLINIYTYSEISFSEEIVANSKEEAKLYLFGAFEAMQKFSKDRPTGYTINEVE